jgi:DHA2 family multidrug resistance protein
LAPAEKAHLETRNRPLLMGAIILIAICQFLDATIANVALPHMQAALGASTDTVSWVLTSFIIATAIATPLSGWLSDRIGSRNLYIASSVMFLLASAACGAATSLVEMVIFRTLQGAASAFIGMLTITTMFDISPPGKQAMTMGIFSMIVMVAPISGPFVGGLLTEYLNWRWIFYVNLPIGVPAVALLWWLLPSRPKVRRPLDGFGFVMIGLSLGSLQLMLDRGQQMDWFNSWEIVIELVVAISAMWMFVLHSIRTPVPLFNRALYRDRNYVLGLAFMAVMGFASVGLSAVLPMMFQTIYGYPVIDSGLMMAPRGTGAMISSLLAGYLARHMDARLIMTVGYLVAATGMWSMTYWGLTMDVQPILTASFLQGFGFGLIVTPMNVLALAMLPPALRPDGASLSGLFRNLGGSIGVSIIVSMLARGQQNSHAAIAANVSGDMIPGVDLPGMVDRLPGFGGGAIALLNGEVSRQAMMISFLDSFHVLTWLLLAFAPLPFLIKRPTIFAQRR